MKETLQTLVRTVGELTDSTYSRPPGRRHTGGGPAARRGRAAARCAAQPTPPLYRRRAARAGGGQPAPAGQRYQAAFKVTFTGPSSAAAAF